MFDIIMTSNDVILCCLYEVQPTSSSKIFLLEFYIKDSDCNSRMAMTLKNINTWVYDVVYDYLKVYRLDLLPNSSWHFIIIIANNWVIHKKFYIQICNVCTSTNIYIYIYLFIYLFFI